MRKIGQWHIQTILETGSLGTQILVPQKTLSSFLSQFYFNKKYIEVEINDFKMHLIISKWLKRQKCRQKRKTMWQEEVEAKEETVYKCFH